MAHSLEARVPFCDPAVAELALALPPPSQGPRARQEAAPAPAVAPLLPRSIVERPEAGLLDPAWRRGCAASWSRSRARSSPRRPCGRQGSVHPERGPGLLDDHVAGREDLSRQIWGLMTLTLWAETIRPCVRGAGRGLDDADRRKTRVPIDALFAFAVALVIAWLLVPVTERRRPPGRRDRLSARAQPAPRCPPPSSAAWRSSSALVVAMRRSSCRWVAPTRALVAGAVVIAAVGVADDLFELGAAPEARRADRRRDVPGVQPASAVIQLHAAVPRARFSLDHVLVPPRRPVSGT